MRLKECRWSEGGEAGESREIEEEEAMGGEVEVVEVKCGKLRGGE